MASKLIIALQTTKIEIERSNLLPTFMALYGEISEAIYSLEIMEKLPYNWRDAIYNERPNLKQILQQQEREFDNLSGQS